MSTITKAIASVEFQANSRQANAAMESIRSSAKECRDEVERLQADLAKGIEVTMVAGQEMDINKRIKQLEGMARSYDQAADSLIKGVKAFDELWKHAQAGNIESMTAAQIRAGMNGAKRVKDQLKLNDPEDRLKNAAIQSMTDESQKVLDKMKLNTDGIIQQLERGESVAKDVLEREQKGLLALMDQLEHGSKEWQIYNAQLVRISKGYDDLIIRERQLKGEIVTREDAMRVANQVDKKATEDAVKNAQQRIDAAEQVIKTKQEEVAANQAAATEAAQNLVGVREEIKTKKEEIAQAKANGEAAKKEARERVAAANDRKNAAVKNAKEQQQAYNTLNGEVNKLRGEVSGLEAQLAALDQQTVKPKVDTSSIDELNEKLKAAEDLLQQKTTEADKAFMDYLKTKGLELHRDPQQFEDQFKQMYGLKGWDASHVGSQNKFKFPYDMEIWEVKDAANNPDSEFAIAGQQAKDILADYNWFGEQIDKVANKIREQYKKLWDANAEGIDPEQLKTVATNIKRLEDLRDKMKQVAETEPDDYRFYIGGEQFRSQFGDIDKTIDNTSKNINRAIKKAIDERFDYHDKKHAVEIQEAKEASELADKEKEAAKIAVDGIKAEIETKKQNAGATKNEVEAVKELIKMRERINELQQEKDSMFGIMPTAGIDKELSELMPKYEAGLKGLSEEARNLVRDFTVAKRDLAGIIKDEKEADEALKQFGITTADVADDLKLQAAAEKALKIEEESRLELAKEMLEVRKQIGAESLKDSRIVGSKKDQDFYKKNKGILEDEYWKGEAGGGSIGRMYKYLNDIADDPEAKAEFQEQVGVSVKDAMRVAGQRMREVLQEAMKRGIKVDDALSDFEDGYGQGPATKIHEFFKEFNEAVSEKEGELIRKRRRKLDAILDVVEDPGDEAEIPSRDERLELAKRALKGVAEGHYGNDTPLAESRRQQEEEVTRLDAKVKEFINTQQQSTAATEEHTQAAEKDAATEQKREELKGKLATASGKLAEKEQELNVQTDKTITANQNLRQAEDDVKQATEQKNEVYSEAKRVVADGEDAVEKLEKKEEEYAETQKKTTQAVAEGTAEINKQSAAQVAAQQEIDQATANSIEKKEQAIKVLEQLNREINDPGNADWQENERTIGRLKQQLEDLRKQSAELRREPLLKEMTERMTDIKNLSVDALGETKKFWEAMYNGADRNDAKLKDFKQHLDDIAAEERRRTEERGKEAMSFFNDKNVFAGVDAEGNQIFRTKAANASAAETVEMAKAMEAYRDSLPKEEGAETIANINRLLEENAEVIKVATGEWMSYTEAEKLASEAAQAGKGEGNFIATQQQMQQAMAAVQREYDKTIKSLQQLERAETKDQTAIDKEKQKLQLLEKQLKDLKFEQDNFNMSHEKMQQLLAEPTKATDLDELKAAIKRADGELRRMKDSLGDGSKQYQEFAAKVKEAKNQLKEIESQSKATTSAWDKAWSRLKTYVGMYMGFNMAWQRITGTADDLMQLSDKLGEVRKTTGFAADEVGRLSDNLRKMDTRTAITGLLDLSVAAGQLGLKTEEDVMGFTEAANKLMVALPEMGQEGATQMLKVALATGEIAKIEKQMQEGLIEGSSATAVAMEKVGSTIDRLRATSAATAPAITDFVKRVGAVGAQSGISIDQVAALGSTVDALGMRVEMSATALSRMIPAIKNNAFQVAKAIGMAPNALRSLFDEAGGGMKAMLAIFQHIKDAGMDEDSIEKMLGMAGMQEVMKELNQQGARAGIVFAGLSQNVDVLRAHLETAADAYEKNVAIQQEYDKMNETTLAKWQRLKNEIEEAFVSDFMQRSLGWLIDRLRDLVNLITGNVEPAFKGLNIVLWMTIGYFGFLYAEIGKLVVGAFSGLIKGLVAIKNGLIAITTVKGLKGIREHLWLLYDETKKYIALKWQLVLAHNAEEKAAIRAKIANNALAKSLNANVVLAVVAAIGMLVWKLHQWHEKSMEAARDAAKFQAELEKETKKVDELFNAVGKAKVQVGDAQKEVDKANKTLKQAQEQTDNTKESTDKLSKAEADLAEKEEILKNKQAVHGKTINDINSIYGKYLGFMLSEVSTAQELANAREMINEKLRETITLKRKEAALERVENEEGEERDTKYANLFDIVTKNSYTKVGKGKLSRDAGLAATMMRDITDLAQNDYKSSEEFRDAIVKMLGGGQYKGNVGGVEKIADKAEEYYTQLSAIRKKNNLVESQFIAEEAVNRKKSQDKLETQYQEATKNYKQLELNYQNAKGDAKKQAAANLLKEMDTITEMVENAEQHYETDEKKGYVRKDQNGKRLGTEKDRFDKFVKDTAGTVAKMKDQREALLKEADNLYQARETVTGDITPHISEANPWGNKLEGSSTDWKNMTADQLVNRRKQMNEFVKAIQTDSDVQSVLGEDAALKKAIENGMSSDMRTVINWYNTERLKIQDELHARYLTNTGAWQDPKQSRARRKRLQDDMRAFLEELDAYYTERNQEIEKAKNDEEITEAEAWRRTIKNEEEWYNRRAELQIMYSNKHAKIAGDEQNAIAEIIAERTGDTADFIMATIAKTRKFSETIKAVNEQGAKEYRKFQGDLDLGSEKDFLKSAKSIGKYMKFIEDTLAKERPYDGITKNLQENLDKMGILAAQYKRINEELAAQGKEKKYSDAQITAATYDEMAFFLKQAENAWSIDIDELLRRMAQEGMVATAEEISKSDLLKQAVMGQLRKTFEEVQNAVKKEASQIKKDVDIIWNDDQMGMGGRSMKSVFDKIIAQLGQQQDSVSRANSLIGAGPASENVAARLGMKQIEVQMRMQKAQFDMYRAQANQRIIDLKKEAAEHKRIAELEEKAGHAEEAAKERLKETIALRDAENVRKSLGLTLSEETKQEEQQKTELLKLQEESQNRLYTSLREWATLFSGSVQSLMEATHAGDAEYYNELAKLNLTGKGGPGAGTYIVIDNEGTSEAKAHYEYLDERAALERQREIEQQNAEAEAWKKVMDDLNMKLSESITDQLNAMLQNVSIDANTDAVVQNTAAIAGLTSAIAGKSSTPSEAATPNITEEDAQRWTSNFLGAAANPQYTENPEEDSQLWAANMMGIESYQQLANASTAATGTIMDNQKAAVQGQLSADQKMRASTQSMFAKMTVAANMYGIAYQAMSNENLSTSQKVQLMAVQAAGQAAISALTATMAETTAETTARTPSVFAWLWSKLGWGAIPVFALFTGGLGALMGLATSSITKSKSQIAQVTGASASAGRLSTGMLTYASGNVNEFTDPASLTPGRSYNVDGADGKTYRAKYTGKNPSTHITNGPEFHLAGEKGREMIIDAGTTRQITMNENEIWQAIKTLSGGGRVQSRRSMRRGVRAFAEGNVDDFETVDSGAAADDLGFDPMAMKDSLDKNNELLERALTNGIKGVFNVYGKDGLIDSYDTGKKNVSRHGERY